MATVKGVKIVKKVFIIAVVLLIIIITYKIITTSPTIKPVANNIITLKSTTNPLDKAKIVSSTDNLINKLDNKEVTGQWKIITQCINEVCSDKKYFDFLIILFTQYKEEIARNDLLMNILAVQRYWGTEDVVTFSKAMTYVDDEIEKTHSSNLKKKWAEVVECNNICQNKNDLFLSLIQKTIA